MESIEKIEKNELNVSENNEETVYSFFEKNRKPILISCIVLLILLVGLIGVLLIRDIMQKDAIAKLDLLVERYEKVKNNLSGEELENPADAEELLTELLNFGKNSFAYPAARAWFMAANIYHERGEWQEARDAWLTAAAKGGKDHLTPVCLFNAAVASESAGDLDAALSNYQKSVTFADFPAAAHAQFSIGRLQETQGDNVAAIAAYRALIENWPSDTDWTNLARSRIIALELAP
ncbi:MAG: tetratricopeptide repeat protein [Spirochaetaceae bacterium]|jgi:tetratricopeptide (TPR) repeat protein|nr:tetratricopeptide repeat protein [Spirochaetaceae bacterium]